MDEQPGIDVTYSWWRIIDENGAFQGRTNTRPAASLAGGMGFEGLLVENFTGTASTLVCRAEAVRAINGFDPALRSNVDLDLLLRLALLREGNIALVPALLTSYRIHRSQITSDWRRMERNWNLVFDKMKLLAPARASAVEMLARGRVSRYFAYIAYVRGDYAAARALMAKAWRTSPLGMLRDSRCRLVTLAVLSTYLPVRLRERLTVMALRLTGRSPEMPR
jgi:hypothetical protein